MKIDQNRRTENVHGQETIRNIREDILETGALRKEEISLMNGTRISINDM